MRTLHKRHSPKRGCRVSFIQVRSTFLYFCLESTKLDREERLVIRATSKFASMIGRRSEGSTAAHIQRS